jgi:hypothetical protein
MRTVLQQELSRLNHQSDRQYTSFQTQEQTAQYLEQHQRMLYEQQQKAKKLRMEEAERERAQREMEEREKKWVMK